MPVNMLNRYGIGDEKVLGAPYVASASSMSGSRPACGSYRSSCGAPIRIVYSRVGRPLRLEGYCTLSSRDDIGAMFRHLLFGIGALDLVSIGSVTFLLLTAAAAACYLPARRASRLGPLAAMRPD